MLETASTVAGLLRGCQINGRFGMQIVETRDRGRRSLGPGPPGAAVNKHRNTESAMINGQRRGESWWQTLK